MSRVSRTSLQDSGGMMGVEVHWMVHVGPNTCGIVLFFATWFLNSNV